MIYCIWLGDKPWTAYTALLTSENITACEVIEAFFALESKQLAPGVVARSEVCPLGMQASTSSIPTSGTFFREELVMKKILPLPLIQEE